MTIPYLKNVSERFKRITSRHSFRVAFKPGRKLKEIKPTCQEPLGERQKHVVYRIPCDCQHSVYVGETWRLFQTRKNEHVSKVRLTKRDMAQGKLSSAEQRMGKEDGGPGTSQCRMHRKHRLGGRQDSGQRKRVYDKEKFVKELSRYVNDTME